MSALFVTGTDTGVGKTFVACALATALRQRGRRVAVMKPVETGVEGQPADALALRAAAADPGPVDDICPYRLCAPLQPPVPARRDADAMSRRGQGAGRGHPRARPGTLVSGATAR